MTGRIALILVLQTIALVAMVAMKQWTLETGRPVLLEMEPVDPRSLLRGDYVILNYAISRLDTGELGGDDEFRRFEPVFVVLEQGERYWIPVSVHHAYPSVREDQVVIRGEVNAVDGFGWTQPPRATGSAQKLLVRYGVENYFVPEGTGRDIERMDAKRIELEVVVDASGTAAIKRVLVDGEPRFVEAWI